MLGEFDGSESLKARNWGKLMLVGFNLTARSFRQAGISLWMAWYYTASQFLRKCSSAEVSNPICHVGSDVQRSRCRRDIRGL
jgi:hypothetical protein